MDQRAKGAAVGLRPDGLMNRLFWGLGIGAFLLHGWVLSRYLVDFPMADEWTDFATVRAFSGRLNWTWLFSVMNNHPRVLHNFFKWADYHITGGNYASFAAFNFAFYFLGSVWIVRALEKEFRTGLGLMLVLLACDRVYENHSWANQGLFFHMVFFTFAAFFATFRKDRWFWAGLPAILVAAFSGLGGIVAAAAFGGVNLLLAAGHFLGHPLAAEIDGPRRSRAWARIGQTALLALALVIWKANATFDNPLVALTYPWTSAFWLRFLNTFSSGFGHEKSHFAHGLVLLVLFGVSLGVLFRRSLAERDYSATASWLKVAGIAAALIGTTAMISMGRGFQGLWTSKLSRYAVFGLFVVPIWWTTILHALNRVRRPWLHGGLVGAIVVLLVINFGNNFQWEKHYSEVYRDRTAQLESLKHYLAGDKSWPGIPGLPPHKVENRLETAQRLKLSYLHTLETEEPASSRHGSN